jgi:hypothetical protein
MALQPKSNIAHIVFKFLDHTQLSTNSGKTRLEEFSAHQRGRYLRDTKASNTHDLSGIQTINPSSRVAANLRPRSHRYWGSAFSHYSSEITINVSDTLQN